MRKTRVLTLLGSLIVIALILIFQGIYGKVSVETFYKRYTEQTYKKVPFGVSTTADISFYSTWHELVKCVGTEEDCSTLNNQFQADSIKLVQYLEDSDGPGGCPCRPGQIPNETGSCDWSAFIFKCFIGLDTVQSFELFGKEGKLIFRKENVPNKLKKKTGQYLSIIEVKNWRDIREEDQVTIKQTILENGLPRTQSLTVNIIEEDTLLERIQAILKSAENN